MKREMLFKGKHKDTGEWVYGDYSSAYSCIIDNDPPGYYFTFGVDPDTVCEWIGRADKNDVKIFEYDFVKHRDKIYQVKYLSEWARFAAVLPNGVFEPAAFSDCEVVGNVFDNPELLNGNLE